MPIYEYVCEDCSTEFELRRSFEEGSLASCPRCEGDVRRVFRPAHIIFKGPGFYVTDSRQSASASEE